MRIILLVLCSLSCILVSARENEGQWIAPSEIDSPNVWMAFRKDVDVKGRQETAVAKIAVDSKYWLWVNGRMVVREGGLKRGPNPQDTYYDEVDLAPYLKKGRNRIALLVWYFGKQGFSHKSSGRAGLLFEMPLAGETVVSDTSWLCRVHPAFHDTDAPYPNYRLPESNIRFDAREDIKGWQTAGQLEKMGFGHAVAVAEKGAAPYNRLVLRPIPQWKDFGVTGFAKVETLKGERLDTMVAYLPYNLQMTPVLDVTDPEGGNMISVYTDNTFAAGDINLRAEYITGKGSQEYESPGWLNGHIVYFVVPKGVRVNRLAYRQSGYDTGLSGSFVCSDDFINKYWQKSLRTLYVNMRDTFFDCPERERAQWWGDETLLAGECFYVCDTTARALMRKGMRELVDWQRPDGVLYSPVPSGNYGDELPGQMLASIGWYGFWNYYMNTGDRQTIGYVYPAVKRYLSLWTLDETGLTAFRSGGWAWGDWGDNRDIRLIFAGWHYLALKGAEQMALVLGYEDDAKLYADTMRKVKEGYNKCWNGKAYRHPEYTECTDDRVQALAVISGIAGPDKYPQISEVFRTCHHASPYMERYVMEALFIMGEKDYAIGRMKERYASMVEHPFYTTLFEGWDIGEKGFGGGTVNHAWSGGCQLAVARHICGLAPETPGWRTFTLRPDCSVIGHTDITVPTAFGKIRSSVTSETGRVLMEVSIPEGTEAYVTVPGDEADSKVYINGMEQPQLDSYTLTAGNYTIERRCQENVLRKGLSGRCVPDERTVQYVRPSRVVWISDTDGQSVRNPENLLRDVPGQVTVASSDHCVLSTRLTGQAGILLDFGKELHGGLQIITGMRPSNRPLRGRIRFGESVTEAMSEISPESSATNDHAMRDFEIELPWLGSLEVGDTGFRFVRIDLMDKDEELSLHSVRAAFKFRDIPYLGSFRSDNERLDRIWETGAYTVHLNMQSYLWDGIKRDRLVWVGDMHPEVMTINSVFGANDVVYRSLDVAKDDTPLPGWMNGMCSYSLWWILIQRDLYLYQGNKEYLKSQHGYLSDLLGQVIGSTDGDRENLQGGVRFLDWPTSESPETIHAGLQALMVMALEAGSELALWLEDGELSRRCEGALRCLRRYVPEHNGNKQAAALLAISGLCKAKDMDRIISAGGADGFSTFFGYYMLEAMALAGDYDGAMRIISDYWGGMLDLGATTFWEDLDFSDLSSVGRIDESVPSGKSDIHSMGGDYCYKGLRHSLCHGWASGPTAWLSRHVLGIVPLEPGCRKVRIEPHLGSLQRVEGTFPTPYGIIRVKHCRTENGKIVSEVDAPEEITVVR